MPHRKPSPAVLENEVDISKVLFEDESGTESDDAGAKQHADRKARMSMPEAMLGMAIESGSDDEAFIAATQAASNRKASNLKGKSVKKGGGFQSMGLNANLLKAITYKGFSVPTPIQRKTIPLLLDGQDVVGMARTGSGKTAAFVIPMIEKLKAHSARVGARALILSPSRELALQTLKVVKELARGSDLKCVLLVGGDSLEEQFASMAANPDIVIATPGRFLHLKVEMGLDLASIRYVVFDEADRLFEMGFAAQLTEILHGLPQTRQTLLFSATLPKMLVEFARAGLQEPNLVRLDADSKISPDLQNAFFTVKSAEKEGALLHILSDIIKIPTGQTEASRKAKDEDATKSSKKRKRDDGNAPNRYQSPTAHSTIVFAATKHHVDYLAALLQISGFAISYAYGSLDQTARKMQVEKFRAGMTNVLVVTDVAARGIDIPVLANVINYDFPAQPKIFVHRVGRTARAGQRGWSYSLIRESDIPYLLDLQLFLGRRMVIGRNGGDKPDYAEDVVIGSLAQDRIGHTCEWVNKILDEDSGLLALRAVAGKGEKLYLRTRNSASNESAKRSKELTASNIWQAPHPLFDNKLDPTIIEREDMLARVSGFRPQETVFEIGKRGLNDETAEIMKKRRAFIEAKKGKRENAMRDERKDLVGLNDNLAIRDDHAQHLDDDRCVGKTTDVETESEEELQVGVSHPEISSGNENQKSWKDSDHFMGYMPLSTNLAEDRGYGVHSGSYNTASQNSNFVEAARRVTMDLNNDEGNKAFAEPSRAQGLRWNKKDKKYVARANDEDGSKGAKMIRGESGQKIRASFKSGRYEAWRKQNKLNRLPRVGEAEIPSSATGWGVGKRYKHKMEEAPKDADKYRDDYYKKKKQVEAAKENRVGRFRHGGGVNEIRGVDDVRRERNMKERRKGRNARPSRKSR